MIDSERMPGDWNSHAKIMHYFGFQNKKRPCSPFPRTMEHPTGGPLEKETDRLFEGSCNQSDMRIDMLCTRSGNRTRTTIAGHRILSPACLPIPPSELPPPRGGAAKIRNNLRFAKIHIAEHRPEVVAPEPANLPVAPEPGHLALGIVPRIALDGLDRLVVGATSVEVVE